MLVVASRGQQFVMGGWPLFITFLVSVAGCVAGLVCTLQARRRREGGEWVGWLTLAAVSIGGAGIWLPHFIVRLGFATPVRLDVTRTVASALLSISVVFVGLLMFGVRARFTVWRLILGGVSTGLTVNLVHYLDMPAMRLQDSMVWLSIAIAVVAAVVALSFTVLFDSVMLCGVAGLLMGFAVTGTLYTGTTAATMRTASVPAGVEAVTFLFPVVFLAMVILLCAVLTASTRSEGEGRRSRCVPARPVPNRPEPRVERHATHAVEQVRGVGRYARLPTIPVQRRSYH